MTSALFTPLTLRELTLVNRIVVSPMCQYSAKDGTPQDWHLVHLGNLAMSGAALVFVEATGVELAGRITPGCTSLCTDDNERAFKRVVDVVRAVGTAKIGIQLGHAGRKASCDVPVNGAKQLALAAVPSSSAAAGWVTFAPSAIPFHEGERAPVALDDDGLARVRRAFSDAVTRAARVGFDVVEMHNAHGYLLHEFLSPLSNHRSDSYGGSLANRMRFPLEVFEAMRAAWPKEKPLGVRVSSTDWLEGGWTVDDTVAYAKELKARGCDFVDCSSGGSSPLAKVEVKPGFQVPFARRVKHEAGIATIAVGAITEPVQAESIIAGDDADLVALAKGMLWNPRWGWHAAAALGEKITVPNPAFLANAKVLVPKGSA